MDVERYLENDNRILLIYRCHRAARLSEVDDAIMRVLFEPVVNEVVNLLGAL